MEKVCVCVLVAVKAEGVCAAGPGVFTAVTRAARPSSSPITLNADVQLCFYMRRTSVAAKHNRREFRSAERQNPILRHFPSDEINLLLSQRFEANAEVIRSCSCMRAATCVQRGMGHCRN